MQIRTKRPQAQINIVPMVDVLTVLIFFFLLTMQFKDVHAVDITPPTMKSASVENQTMPNILTITKDGQYTLNNKKILFSNLKTEFEKISKSKDSTILVYADKDTSLKFVTDAIDTARLTKIKKVSLRSIQ
ncbi:MAG: biopolymer transporter ExbD [Verrucomicrobiaceae bacterium]|nr:biopolymer transporter ExbD [Verrucomicrobiaceae bacterium]